MVSHLMIGLAVLAREGGQVRCHSCLNKPFVDFGKLLRIVGDVVGDG